MGSKNLDNKYIRKLTKTGGGKSICVTIPIDYIRDFGWDSNQEVVVKKEGNKIIIENWESQELPFDK